MHWTEYPQIFQGMDDNRQSSLRFSLNPLCTQVLEGLGITPGAKVVTFMFGAHVLTLDLQAHWLPEGWECVVCCGGNRISTPLPLSVCLST